MWGEIENGVIMQLNEPSDRQAAFQAIGNLRVHKGVDWKARKHSLELAAEFLEESLF